MFEALRLQPFAWSVGQALAWGTISGAVCGMALGLVNVWPLLPGLSPELNFIAQFACKALLLGGVSGLVCASASLGRNIVARAFYFRGKLETLRRTSWSYRELALAGFCAFGFFPFAVIAVATRFFGLPMPTQRLPLTLFGAACIGALYLTIIGAVRNNWARRRERAAGR